MEAALLKKFYTIEDLENLPDDFRAELIDGVIYDVATPNRIHQRLVLKISNTIDNYITANHGTCEVYTAPFAVIIAKDDYNYVEPDVCVICDPEKLSDRGCEGAPDLIVEIVSPSSRKMDYAIKLPLYMKNGVREYWIVDPMRCLTFVYLFEGEDAPSLGCYPFPVDVPVGIYPGFHLNIYDMLHPEAQQNADPQALRFFVVPCASFGKLLHEARIQANLTRRQLAARTGIYKLKIKQIEEGIENPSLKIMKKLAKGVGRKLDFQFIP